MPRYLAELAYNGKDFSGYQRQKDVPSVQQTLEEALTKVLKRPILIHGCGRTDAKVHASQYFMHFDFNAELRPDFLRIINWTLPATIKIRNVSMMEEVFNVQHAAKRRTYRYRFHSQPNPFLIDLSYEIPFDTLDFSLMEQGLKLVENATDFEFFCKSPDKANTTFCNIFSTSLQQENSEEAYFEICANRFLRAMVRRLVGSLFEIGKGNYALEDFEKHLNKEASPPYFHLAEPQGLYLARVEY